METRERVRGLRGRIAALTGGAPFAPLLILFGLNAVDELDRSAFGLLLPEIRDEFGLNLTGVTALSAAVIPAGLIFALPIARWGDRGSRARIAIGGAVAWGVFSILTGLSPAILLLAAARVGAGLGRAVNNPLHPSMLSDFYPPIARAKVMSAHRVANPLGQFTGPLVAGFIAAAIGWRLPFVILAVPTFLLVLVAMRMLREPERTGQRMLEGDPRLREAFRSIWGVATLRRLLIAIPFIAFVTIGMQPLTSVYYADVFGVPVARRGIIQAFDSPFTVVGLIVGATLIDRGVLKDPGRAIRVIALCAAAIAIFITGMAFAPNVGLGVAFNYATNILAPILLTGGIVIVSLVAPPESRSSSFALFEIFGLFGVIALPIVGIVGDAVAESMGDAAGVRVGLAILPPMLLVGSALVARAARYARDDIARVYPDYGRTPAPVEEPDITTTLD